LLKAPAASLFHYKGIKIAALPMFDATKYSAVETLRNGLRIEIRALRPEDRADLIKAVHSMSANSLSRRFFAVRREFVLPENVAMLKVFENSGFPVKTVRDFGVVHVTLRLS
jgi:hypothetical protein